MAALFVTATGTDAGKTFLTECLLRHLRRSGRNATGFKPVASGFDPDQAAESDTGKLLSALDRPLTADACAAITPWQFRAPLSPDMAATREGRSIDFSTLVSFSQQAAQSAEIVFIEGVGGVMVPLDRSHTVRDWIEALGLPSILVAGSYLGAISHTLTAAEALLQRGCRIALIVVNETAGSTVALDETADTISRYVPDVPLRTLPRLPVADGRDPAISAIAHALGL